MKLSEAVEHKKRIMTCIEHVNLAVDLAVSAGLNVEIQLTEYRRITGESGSVLTCAVLMDPTTLDDLA